MQINGFKTWNRQTVRNVPLWISTLVAFAMLSACASHDGLYEPDCIAFEGDRVVFAGERFEWHKFTDQLEINRDGEVIDPFPGYPKSGELRLSNDRVEFWPDDGSRIDDHFIAEQQNSRYLLTGDQHQNLLVNGVIARCALKQTGTET